MPATTRSQIALFSSKSKLLWLLIATVVCVGLYVLLSAAISSLAVFQSSTFAAAASAEKSAHTNLGVLHNELRDSISFDSLSNQISLQNYTGLPLVIDIDQARTPSRQWPDDPMNIGGWIGYILGLILILIVPILLGIALFIVCCCFCCLRKDGYLGSSKPSEEFEQGYTNKQRKLVWIPFALVFIFVFITTIVGIILSALFTQSSVTMIERTSTLADDGLAQFRHILDVLNSPTGVDNATQAIIDKAYGLFDLINNVYPVIDGIVDVVANASTNVDSISNTVTAAGHQVALTRQLMADMRSQATWVKDYIPDPSTVPDPSQYMGQIDSVRTALDQAQNTINSTVLNSFKDTLNQYRPKISEYGDTVKSAVASVQSSVGPAVTNALLTTPVLKDVYAWVNDTNNREQVKTISTSVDRAVMTVIIVLYCFGAVLLATGLICVFTQRACWMCFTAVILMIFTVLYFIVAGIELFVTSVVSDTCTQTKPYLYRVENVVNKYVNVTSMIQGAMSGLPPDLKPIVAKVSTSPVNLTLSIASCTGNQTILDAVGISMNDVFDFAAGKAKELINGTLSGVSIDNFVQQAQQQVSQFTVSGLNSTFFDVGLNITQLNVTFQQANAIFANPASAITFNSLNISDYYAALDSLNQITKAKDGKIYTCVLELPKATYCNVSTIVPIAYAPQDQEVQNYRDAIVTVKDKYDQTTVLLQALQYNTTKLFDQVLVLTNMMADVKVDANLLLTLPQQVLAQFNKVYAVVDTFKQAINQFADDAIRAIATVLPIDSASIGCGILGDYMKNQVNTICTDMVYQVQGVGVTGLILGIALFTLVFPVLLIMGKRFGHRFKMERALRHANQLSQSTASRKPSLNTGAIAPGAAFASPRNYPKTSVDIDMEDVHHSVYSPGDPNSELKSRSNPGMYDDV